MHRIFMRDAWLFYARRIGGLPARSGGLLGRAAASGLLSPSLKRLLGNHPVIKPTIGALYPAA
jgi:hypothetical protein